MLVHEPHSGHTDIICMQIKKYLLYKKYKVEELLIKDFAKIISLFDI